MSAIIYIARKFFGACNAANACASDALHCIPYRRQQKLAGRIKALFSYTKQLGRQRTLMSLQIVAFAACLFIPNLSAATVNCTPVRPVGGVDDQVSREISQHSDNILSSLGGGDINTAFADSTRDAIHKYPNADKVFIWQSFIFVACQILSESAWSDDQKLSHWQEMIVRYQSLPPILPSRSGEGAKPAMNPYPVPGQSECKAGPLTLTLFSGRSNLSAETLENIVATAGTKCFKVKKSPNYANLMMGLPANTLEFNDSSIGYRVVQWLSAELDAHGIMVETITYPSGKVPGQTIWLDSTPYGSDGKPIRDSFPPSLVWSRKMSTDDQNNLNRVRGQDQFLSFARALGIP